METNLAENQPEQSTAAPVQAESAPAPAEQSAPVKADDSRNPKWFDERIGELTARYHNERIAREAAERKLSEPREKPAEDFKAKTLEDFGYDEAKYQFYLFDTAEKRAVEAAKRVRLEEQTEAQKASRIRKFREREVEFEKANPDYRDLAYTAPFNETVAELITEFEDGPEIALHLGKNKSFALHLNDLPPHVVAIELGRIDARLKNDRAAKAAALEAAKAAKAVSQAPPPAGKIDGASQVIDKDPHQMTDLEYAKWRKKQISQRR